MTELENPVRRLTDEEVDTFWRDGVVLVRNMYSEKWVDILRQGLNQVCGIDDDVEAETREPFFRADAYTWHTNDLLRDFSLFAPTAHFAQQALRSDRVNLFCDQVFVKQAYNAERTPWHHDFTFFPLTGNQVASVWTSVDPVRSDESALEFVIGSHLWPQRFRPLGVGGVVKSVAEMAETPDFNDPDADYEIASWDMAPGDAVIFHALTLHGSQGKPAGKLNRRALATRWCGDDVRFTPTGKELQVPWHHGLAYGDPIGGPIFPEILPEFDYASLAERMKGPVPPDRDLLARNRALAAQFEKVPL